MRRVVEGVYHNDPDEDAKWEALEAMRLGLWVPGGRIHAAAGTSKVTTMINCYVDRTIEDSMNGIADALKDAMFTMQQGGGIGMDFSTLRPAGAHLQRTGAVASGPLPFMDMWNAMCTTIMSAGSRRGAMMAVMHCEHPDIIDFITAKNQPGRLTNFNVSVLVTDAFMAAVEEDEDWYLGFHVPRHDGRHILETERDDGEVQGKWYGYKKIRARELWDMITEHTYEYSEPGVIFIDRINDTNNLNYCETIAATNPCGEQPLPPNGACNLGAVNLARMVKDPFTEDAQIDRALLRRTVRIGVRFLDNVIDTTNYPLEAQDLEEHEKRRIGLGFTGLANALEMLNIHYDSVGALELAEDIARVIRDEAYKSSALLAKERGSFPMYDPSLWGKTSPVVQTLPPQVKKLITQHGIRNGVLLTIAPTGTTSLYVGNVSSGIEPVFNLKVKRRIRQGDDTHKEYVAYDYAYLLHQQLGLPEREWCTLDDVTVKGHIQMQAAVQKYIDASISKTVNCPKEMSLEALRHVYNWAYESGCKGCTTYRPSDLRGSVIDFEDASIEAPNRAPIPPRVDGPRPEVLEGFTYKVKWPMDDASYYITINELEGIPYEMFITSNSSRYSDWLTALGLLISALMRRGDNIAFIPEELLKVKSFTEGVWQGGKYYGSLVARIGETLQQHMARHDGTSDEAPNRAPADLDPVEQHLQLPAAYEVSNTHGGGGMRGEMCPQCHQPTVVRQEGCDKCTNCTFSRCG